MNIVFYVSGPIEAAVKAYKSVMSQQKMLFVLDNAAKEQLADIYEIPYSRVFSIVKMLSSLMAVAGVEVVGATDILDMPFEAQTFVAALLLAKRLDRISLAQLDGLTISAAKPVYTEQFGSRTDQGTTQPLQRFVVVGTKATVAQLRATVQLLGLANLCEWEWSETHETTATRNVTEKIHIPDEVKIIVKKETQFWPDKELLYF